MVSTKLGFLFLAITRNYSKYRIRLRLILPVKKNISFLPANATPSARKNFQEKFNFFSPQNRAI
jgi:hypothetical protein